MRGDTALFERIALEAFQSGLSWLTILRRREGFRAAFRQFEPAAVAAMTDADVEQLLGNEAIIRNRRKIEATIANARALVSWQDEHPNALDALIWSFTPEPSTRTRPATLADVPSATDSSRALAAALRDRGFRFVGVVISVGFFPVGVEALAAVGGEEVAQRGGDGGVAVGGWRL